MDLWPRVEVRRRIFEMWCITRARGLGTCQHVSFGNLRGATLGLLDVAKYVADAVLVSITSAHGCGILKIVGKADAVTDAKNVKHFWIIDRMNMVSGTDTSFREEFWRPRAIS